MVHSIICDTFGSLVLFDPQLLQCPSTKLADSLTHRTLEAKTDVVRTTLSTEQAFYGRDAFAKAIYERMFLWLVERLNSSLENKVCTYVCVYMNICVDGQYMGCL